MPTDVLEHDLSRSDPLDVCYLAQLKRESGDVLGALAALKEASRRFPDSGLVWCDRAAALVLADRAAQAVKAAKKALDLLPDSSAPREVLGDAYARLGKLEKAVTCWERALDLGTCPDRRAVQRKIDRAEKERTVRWRAFHHDDSDRLWAIKVDGAELTIRYGTVGAKGRRQNGTLPSRRAAREQAARLIARKLREGYVEVDADRRTGRRKRRRGDRRRSSGRR